MRSGSTVRPISLLLWSPGKSRCWSKRLPQQQQAAKFVHDLQLGETAISYFRTRRVLSFVPDASQSRRPTLAPGHLLEPLDATWVQELDRLYTQSLYAVCGDSFWPRGRPTRWDSLFMRTPLRWEKSLRAKRKGWLLADSMCRLSTSVFWSCHNQAARRSGRQAR